MKTYKKILKNEGLSILFPFIIATMVYLASLFLFLGFLINTVTNEWKKEIFQTVILQIDKNDKNSSDNLKKTVKILHKSKDIVDYKVLSSKEKNEILIPWFGRDAKEYIKNTPYIIEIEIKPNVFKIKKLRQQIKEISPSITISGIGNWQKKIEMLSKSFYYVILILILFILIITSSIVIIVIKGFMKINDSTIEVLLLIGAENNFISKEFSRYILNISFNYSLIGFTFACITLYSLKIFLSEIYVLPVSPVLILSVLIIPIVIIFNYLVTKATIRITLNKKFNKRRIKI